MGATAFLVPYHSVKLPRRSLGFIEGKRPGNTHREPSKTISMPSFSVLFSSSSSPEDEKKNETKDEASRADVGSSLEILALSVTVFFFATIVFVGGDKLFATPSPTTSSRVVIDADAILREDFEKSSTTVLF